MTDEPEAPETSKLVLLSKDRVFSKIVRENGVLNESDHTWLMSSPVPGTTLKTWEIYQKVQIVLSKADSGNYQIFRSINLITYLLVHDHATEIYDIFWVDEGHMVFSATDGWFETTDSGLTWPQMALATLPAKAFAVIRHIDGSQNWIVYGLDQKVYVADYPDGAWQEVLDTTATNSGRWYPAMAGSSVCILAGAGPYLFRAMGEDPATWTLIKTLDDGGIIKNIRISDFSRVPMFFIIVENPNGDHVFISRDLGDSMTEELGTRIDPKMAIESIVPTLTDSTRTTFTVVGRRTRDVDAPFTFKVIES